MALTLRVPLARNEAGDLQVEGTRVFLAEASAKKHRPEGLLGPLGRA